MATIEIDFEVFKELTLKRKSEEVTYNDVLRELLGLPKATSQENKGTQKYKDFVTKGQIFPHGTDLRASHKGQFYYAKIEDGVIIIDGKKYTSFSAAAIEITNVSTNGWSFWECKFPEKNNWTPVKNLRKC